VGESGCPGVAELVEEAVQCGFGPSWSGPDQAAGVVVDNDDQVAVRPSVRDLVDPDPTQTGQTINRDFDVVVDAGDDRSDRPPRNPQQLTRRRLRCPHRKPRRHCIEIAGVTHIVPRPRHLNDGRTVNTTPDPWSVGLDEYLRRARIKATPASPARPLVIARRSATAPATPAPRSGIWTDRDDNCVLRIVEMDTLDNAARQPTRTSPYTVDLHPVLLPAVPSL